MKKVLRITAIFACALAVYAVGIAARWGVLAVQEAKNGDTPFTMESALAFRYGEMAGTAGLPETDIRIAAPQGLQPRASLNLAAPVLFGKAYAASQGLWRTLGITSLQDFYKKISAVVFCAGVAALFGCAWTITGSLVLGTLGALGYAVLVPALLRSTGQELMSENFSLPLIWLHFFFTVLACKAHAGGRKNAFGLWTVVSALSLAAAWIVWDMVQVYLLLWVVAAAFLIWKELGSRGMRVYALVSGLALFAAAISDPYLRAHGAWSSYPLCLVAALAVASWSVSKPGARGLGLFSVLAVLFCWVSFLNPLGEASYGHFLSLLGYKLKFLNVKPDNPALLPYEVRALWVPALHSATWQRTWTYFGPSLFLWLAALGILGWRWVRGRATVTEKTVAGMGIAFAVLSVLFVRMEVFWIFFLALGIALAAPQVKWVRPAWTGILALLLFSQANILGAQSHYLGRDVDYKALNDVVRWVRERTPEDAVVLASYSLSPSFAAYSGRSIVLQPKYETPAFRESIREFERTLVSEEESEFYLLCERWGVGYYVHSKGFYADHSVNSFRYLVGLPQPSSKTNLVKFELNPRFLNRFRLLYQNDKYLVYRVVDPDDLRKSQFCLNMGRDSISKGLPQRALRWCYRALVLNPGEDRARFLAVKSYSTMGDVSGAKQEATRLFERMQVLKMQEPLVTSAR